MADRKKGKVRNANRRLGNRLWSPEGVEYAREILSDYYLTKDQLSSAVADRRPRMAILADHSAIEWPSDQELAVALEKLSPDGTLTISHRPYRPTLWAAPGGRCVVLFEEQH